MPITDNNLIVRTSTHGALLADSIISLELFGTPLSGMALIVQIPTATQGCLPTLSVDVHASTTSAAASTDPVVGSRSGMTANAEYVVPFSTEKRSVAFAFRIGGGSTPGFSLVTAHVSLGFGQDWRRDVRFL